MFWHIHVLTFHIFRRIREANQNQNHAAEHRIFNRTERTQTNTKSLYERKVWMKFTYFQVSFLDLNMPISCPPSYYPIDLCISPNRKLKLYCMVYGLYNIEIHIYKYFMLDVLMYEREKKNSLQWHVRYAAYTVCVFRESLCVSLAIDMYGFRLSAYFWSIYKILHAFIFPYRYTFQTVWLKHTTKKTKKTRIPQFRLNASFSRNCANSGRMKQRPHRIHSMDLIWKRQRYGYGQYHNDSFASITFSGEYLRRYNAPTLSSLSTHFSVFIHLIWLNPQLSKWSPLKNDMCTCVILEHFIVLLYTSIWCWWYCSNLDWLLVCASYA